MSKPIVISHAHDDMPLSTEVLNLMATGMNITREEVFCTSAKGSDTPSGKNFLEHIKNEFKEAKAIVLLISENYLASHFCTAESGASWVLEDGESCRIIPIAVPPVKKSKLKATLAVTQGHNITDSDSWDDIKDELLSSISGKTSTAQWNVEKKSFLEKLPDLIRSLPKPEVVDPEEYEELVETVDYLETKNAELEKKISEQDEFIVALEKLKNQDQVRKVRIDSLGEFEALEELGQRLRNAISALPSAGQDAMYYHAKGDPLPAPPSGLEGKYEWQEIGEAIDDRVIQGEDSLELNIGHPKVYAADEALEDLRAFLNEHEDTLAPVLIEEWQCTYDLADKNFWSKVTHL